jgi:hypothetical protein
LQYNGDGVRGALISINVDIHSVPVSGRIKIGKIAHSLKVVYSSSPYKLPLRVMGSLSWRLLDGTLAHRQASFESLPC